MKPVCLLLAAVFGSAEAEYSWVRSATKGTCAGIIEPCTDVECTHVVAIGPCETEGVAPTAYIETSLEAAAMVKSDYLNCAADNSCDSKVAESRGTGPGYRDFTAEAEDGADGEYAYMMVGNLFGELWGGYLGAASYFNTGSTTISALTNDVFVAHPDIAGHVTRGESIHGAPIGGNDGISVCIATSTAAADASCTGTRSFPPGTFKFSIFGYTYEAAAGGYAAGYNAAAAADGDWGFEPDYFGVRQKVTGHGFEASAITFNNGAFDLDSLGNNDVSQMTIEIDGTTETIDYTFPTSYRWGNVVDGGDATSVQGGGTVKIKVSPDVVEGALHIDYLFPIGEFQVANKYFIYDPDITTKTGSSGSGDDSSSNPCFDRESTTVCKLADAAASPSAAFGACFGGAANDAAARVPMADLRAGDVVLSTPTESTRVIVNEHVAMKETSPMLTIAHADGELKVTPDHVLLVDGAFKPAREAVVGATLSSGSRVERVTASAGGIINPITTSGRVLAAGKIGMPVVASVYGAWIADYFLDVATYPVPYSLGSGLSYAFPELVQAYHDAWLEPAFMSSFKGLDAISASAPSAVVGLVVVGLDVALAAGLGAYALATNLATAVAVAAVAVTGAAALRRKA